MDACLTVRLPLRAIGGPRRGRRRRAAVPAHRPGRVPVGRLTGDRAARSEASWPLPKPAAFPRKHRRTRVVAVRITVDCCSPAAHAAVGGWDGAEPSSCTSVTPRASPVRRIVSMQIVHSGCRNERLPRRYRRRAAAARQRIFAPVTNHGEPNCCARCPANRQGSARRRRKRRFCAGIAIASLATELVARVPVPPLCGASGPRAAARAGDIRPGARRDKSPGDLGGQDWRHSGLANPRSALSIERRGLHHETHHIAPDRSDDRRRRAAPAWHGPRRRRNSTSPGRSMSAGCRGPMRPKPAS